MGSSQQTSSEGMDDGVCIPIRSRGGQQQPDKLHMPSEVESVAWGMCPHQASFQSFVREQRKQLSTTTLARAGVKGIHLYAQSVSAVTPLWPDIIWAHSASGYGTEE